MPRTKAQWWRKGPLFPRAVREDRLCTLIAALALLPAREWHVLVRSYGLGLPRPEIEREIAATLHVHRSRIGAIRRRAEDRLAIWLRAVYIVRQARARAAREGLPWVELEEIDDTLEDST